MRKKGKRIFFDFFSDLLLNSLAAQQLKGFVQTKTSMKS